MITIAMGISLYLLTKAGMQWDGCGLALLMAAWFDFMVIILLIDTKGKEVKE